MSITASIKILPLFEKYLQWGYYPFYKESIEDYPSRLQEIVSLIIDTDLPAVEEIEYSTVQKAKKMLMILAERVPFTPNISQLCKELETTRDVGLKLLYALDRAALLKLLTTQAKSYKSLSKPEKIYLNNTKVKLLSQAITATRLQQFLIYSFSSFTASTYRFMM